MPPSDGEQLHFSPDGKRLALTAADHAALVINADGTGSHALPLPKGAPNLACVLWSPDGARLACEGFDDAKPSRNGMYTVRASDGGDFRRLSSHRDVPCGYSPDGRQLLFTRITSDAGLRNEIGNLMVMNADGSGSLRSVHKDVGLSCDWAPDGETFLAQERGHLILVDLHGKVTSIPTEVQAASLGSFSPDGTHVAFSGRRAGGSETDIYTVRIDGAELTQITSTSAQSEEWSDWGP
jgi:WD40 repeat protein